MASVINEERIVTTVTTKANAARPLVEKMITLAKKGTLAPSAIARVATLALSRSASVRETAMLEPVDAKLVKRAADRAKRKEEKLKAMQEGREQGGGGREE